MANANDTEAMLIQNLTDAGCDDKTKDICIALIDSGKIDKALDFLLKYRSELLYSIRYRQKQLDCLDYLIYRLKK